MPQLTWITVSCTHIEDLGTCLLTGSFLGFSLCRVFINTRFPDNLQKLSRPTFGLGRESEWGLSSSAEKGQKNRMNDHTSILCSALWLPSRLERKAGTRIERQDLGALERVCRRTKGKTDTPPYKPLLLRYLSAKKAPVSGDSSERADCLKHWKYLKTRS